MNDTEKEGDGERQIRNWKLLMLYFKARSRSMKYAYEIMRFISCVKALYSEKVSNRVINGQFVNFKGGAGGNIPNDLKQEHIVKYNKGILKGLCGNKSLKAVQIGTSSAFGLKVTVDNFEEASGVHKESTSHTHASREEDEKEMIKILSQLQPFKFQEGRYHKAYHSISKSVLDKLDIVALTEWLNKHKRRLSKNKFASEHHTDNNVERGDTTDEESETNEFEDDNDL